MMGQERVNQSQLFYMGINLEKRVRANHPLRRIESLLDLSFIPEKVRDHYGYNGNVSVPPVVVVKLMLLLTFYNVRSERELMDTVPERLDWLWFLGYDIDSEIPNHSILSKARRKWGVDIFREIFERVVWQCVEAGLVDGKKIFMDSSLVDADASNNSVIDRQSLKRYLNESYVKMEERLEEIDKETEVNRRYVSTTDPEASIVKHGGQSKLRYKTHRAIDEECGVITATEITSGNVNESYRLTSLVEQHHNNTLMNAKTVVADSQYGTKDNYYKCNDRGIKAHISDLKGKQNEGKRHAGIFSIEAFKYDGPSDTYTCPAGQRLTRRTIFGSLGINTYRTTASICKKCSLRTQCTRSKACRTIQRDNRQKVLDNMRRESRSESSKKDILIRQHFMERSFAEGKRYGLKRCRWRGIWRARVQDYLIATIQNINLLIEKGYWFNKALGQTLRVENGAILEKWPLLLESIAIRVNNTFQEVHYLFYRSIFSVPLMIKQYNF